MPTIAIVFFNPNGKTAAPRTSFSNRFPEWRDLREKTSYKVIQNRLKAARGPKMGSKIELEARGFVRCFDF
jgi:hypothetical protein